MKLSIIIPAFNEKVTILESIARVERAVLPFGAEKEIIVIDDGSTDGTTDILARVKDRITVVRHPVNQGKGAAIRTALTLATGSHIVTHDGDLENDPRDLARMLEEMVDRNLTALYGSRRLGRDRKVSGARATFYAGGVFLSCLANVLYGQHITDEPTCYKMFKAEFLKSLPLKCERFEYCPEVTALTSRRGVKIEEIPIAYQPRDIAHGKKIRLKDGIEAVKTLIVCRFRKI